MEAEQAIKHLNGTIPPGAVDPVTVKFANSPTSLVAAGPGAASAKNNNGLNIPAPVASPSYIAAAAAAAAASRRMLGQLHNPATGKIRYTRPSRIIRCQHTPPKFPVVYNRPRTHTHTHTHTHDFLQCVGQVRKVHETTTLLLVTLSNIHRLKKNSLAHSTINLS